MASKKFKFRIDSDGRIGIKEVISRVSTSEDTRINVSMGVTKEFNLAPLAVFENGVLVPLNANSNANSNQTKNKPIIYYPLDSMLYICTLSVAIKNNIVKQKEVTIYIPKGLISENELHCERVTGLFTQDVRNAIANNLMTFALSRL